jgi:recombinational DNA repair protein (RecF pathway)
MHIEGLIISKTPYKERDLICNLLLRSGNTLSVYFYGGRGGGKNSKGSVLEVGHMLAITLSPRRKSLDTQIHISKEYKLLWASDHTRLDYKAFYLSMFYMEYMSKVAQQEDLDFESLENAGLFSVLSNSLFYLDKLVEKKEFFLENHLFFFLTKLCIQLGVVPGIENCLYCDTLFKARDMCLFDPKDGGFSCMECASQKDQFLSDNKLLLEEYQSSQALREIFQNIFKLSYKDFETVGLLNSGMTYAIFNYINFQFGFSKDQFKTWGMVGS